MLVNFKSFLLRAGDAVQKVLTDVLRSLFQNKFFLAYFVTLVTCWLIKKAAQPINSVGAT